MLKQKKNITELIKDKKFHVIKKVKVKENARLRVMKCREKKEEFEALPQQHKDVILLMKKEKASSKKQLMEIEYEKEKRKIFKIKKAKVNIQSNARKIKFRAEKKKEL